VPARVNVVPLYRPDIYCIRPDDICWRVRPSPRAFPDVENRQKLNDFVCPTRLGTKEPWQTEITRQIWRRIRKNVLRMLSK